MNERIAGGRPVAWEDAGRQIAPLLGSYSAVVVGSSEPLAAAHVALGIARAEALRRKVVVGDLVGDLAPLSSLLSDDDPHGISDSVLYGISITRIRRAVADTENLFVLPSGTEPVATEEIFLSERWKRLATVFAESGDLLLLVARSDSPAVGALIDAVDGAVVVRDTELSGAPSAVVLARVSSPTRTLKLPFIREVELPPLRPRPKWFFALSAASLLALAAMALLLFRSRTGVESDVGDVTPTPTVSPPAIALDTLLAAAPINAAESATAAAFAVELLVANTAEGANFVLRKGNASLPAATVAPTPIGAERETWYKVIAGAYTRRSEADSLLRALRAGRVIHDSAGSVLRLPLALLVDSVDTQGGIRDAVTAAVAKYTARGLPVYALMQDDGGARLYAGAFERADNAAELLKTLREAGLQPTLAYRTGRTP